MLRGMKRERTSSVDELLERARIRWPAVPFDRAEALRAQEGLAGSSGGVRFPEDLLLALACMRGDTAAQAALDREFIPAAARLAARLSPTPEFEDEVGQALRTRLFLSDPKRPARIGDYDGSTALVAWVRLLARHAAIDLLRGRPRPSSDGPDPLLQHFESHTPEKHLAKDRFQAEFGRALSDAMSTLDSRDRAALRLHFGEGVPLEGVAAAYGVHRATAARWIATARATVLGRTKQNLGKLLGASEGEIDSILREARSDLDVSISAVFRSADG
jgi:RNA polymerase sigma-70 factor (ECF subfamily)